MHAGTTIAGLAGPNSRHSVLEFGHTDERNRTCGACCCVPAENLWKCQERPRI